MLDFHYDLMINDLKSNFQEALCSKASETHRA